MLAAGESARCQADGCSNRRASRQASCCAEERGLLRSGDQAAGIGASRERGEPIFEAERYVIDWTADAASANRPDGPQGS